MTVQTSSVASFNELAAYFRQRQAAADGDRWYGGSWYEGGVDQWIQWPEWLNSRCDDRYSALDAGGCCRDSDNAAIRLALCLSDVAQEILGALDRGDRGCAAAETELSPLVAAVPAVLAAIRGTLAGADRPLAVQLGCALDRVSLFVGRLAARRRCPWRCARHGRPDRGTALLPVREELGECSELIWDALHPRARVRT
jgi:hypothetical protein